MVGHECQQATFGGSDGWLVTVLTPDFDAWGRGVLVAFDEYQLAVTEGRSEGFVAIGFRLGAAIKRQKQCGDLR